MPYRIREVDFEDEEISETLDELHGICFEDTAPPINHDQWGRWWIAYYDKEPVAFAALVKSRRFKNAGYLYRSGVVPGHQGHGLQKRLISARVLAAKKMGLDVIYTDTNENPASSNSLIARGFRLYEPERPYSPIVTALYFRLFL